PLIVLSVEFSEKHRTGGDESEEAFNQTEFELPIDQKIKFLSKGQNVRLGLVLALAHRPELVILDDPALGLDPIMRKQFNRDLITHCRAKGGPCFTARICCTKWSPWPMRWRFWTKGGSSGRRTLNFAA
ncbi:MAG: hypothetical protein HC771_24190, partial [Synechococcales cyanobacterium CRU_2_2]|nr:hypothetical protein [Synechococcales cyanobacterium CRU_2_2]